MKPLLKKAIIIMQRVSSIFFGHVVFVARISNPKWASIILTFGIWNLDTHE